MTKMLDIACPPGPCSVRCARGAAGGAVLNRRDAPLMERLEAGVRKALGLYRQLVDIEIGRASEHGARWWSRRLVDMYEEAGLVRLDD